MRACTLTLIATKKTANLEGVVQELKETLKSLKTAIVDLVIIYYITKLHI